MIRIVPVLLLFILLTATFSFADAPTYVATIEATHPHDVQSSTQGLFFHNGVLYESSGGFGESYLAVVDINSGCHFLKEPIDREFFAEGITPYKNRLFMLTWLSGTGFIHSMDNLQILTTFASRPNNDATEGWGLTFDGARFILSSGKTKLRFHRPEDFSLSGSVLVHDDGAPVRLLNELEYVGGMILANIWKQDRIAVIDPEDGRIRAWIDISPLRAQVVKESGVANGIAYDKLTGRLFVTGKNWDKLFEISIDEVLWRQPVNVGAKKE